MTRFSPAFVAGGSLVASRARRRSSEGIEVEGTMASRRADESIVVLNDDPLVINNQPVVRPSERISDREYERVKRFNVHRGGRDDWENRTH